MSRPRIPPLRGRYPGQKADDDSCDGKERRSANFVIEASQIFVQAYGANPIELKSVDVEEEECAFVADLAAGLHNRTSLFEFCCLVSCHPDVSKVGLAEPDRLISLKCRLPNAVPQLRW